jgi:hypothetical protein
MHLEATTTDYATFAATDLGRDAEISVEVAAGSGSTTLRREFFLTDMHARFAVRIPCRSLPAGRRDRAVGGLRCPLPPCRLGGCVPGESAVFRELCTLLPGDEAEFQRATLNAERLGAVVEVRAWR